MVLYHRTACAVTKRAVSIWRRLICAKQELEESFCFAWWCTRQKYEGLGDYSLGFVHNASWKLLVNQLILLVEYTAFSSSLDDVGREMGYVRIRKSNRQWLWPYSVKQRSELWLPTAKDRRVVWRWAILVCQEHKIQGTRRVCCCSNSLKVP